MPVYNGEHFIRDALDSLLSQTFTDFELIISDNASTDGTEAICREYARKDARIRYVRHSQNHGGLENCVFVLNEAMGDYFMWAADDDVWDENWIAELYKTVSAGTDLFAYGKLVMIDGGGDVLAHPAQGRVFQFDHPWAVWRRLRFVLIPDVYGKANCFYALFPRTSLAKIRFDPNATAIDLMFLFDGLKRLRLRGSESTRMYKRHHNIRTGTPDVTVTATNERKVTHYGRLLRNILLLETRLARSFIRHSGDFEKLLVIILSPLRIMGALWGAVLMSWCARTRT